MLLEQKFLLLNVKISILCKNCQGKLFHCSKTHNNYFGYHKCTFVCMTKRIILDVATTTLNFEKGYSQKYLIDTQLSYRRARITCWICVWIMEQFTSLNLKTFPLNFQSTVFAFELVCACYSNTNWFQTSGLQEFLFQCGLFTVSDYWCSLTANTPCVDAIGSSKCGIIMHHTLR